MEFDQKRLEKISKLFYLELFDDENGKMARDYIEKDRDISLSLIKDKEIGFCPTWVKYPHPFKRVVEGHMWYMRGRIVITIRDQWGKILGFNGRKIDECEKDLKIYLTDQFGEKNVDGMISEWSCKKWVNEIFAKSNVIFGLFDKKKSMLKDGFAVLVEGCMDAITMDCFGVPNTLALLGTSFGPIQAALLKRYVDHIVLCFDSDEAGVSASKKIAEIAGSVGDLSWTNVLLKKGMDPEDAIKHPKENIVLKWAIKEASSPKRKGNTIDLSNSGTRIAALAKF